MTKYGSGDTGWVTTEEGFTLWLETYAWDIFVLDADGPRPGEVKPLSVVKATDPDLYDKVTAKFMEYFKRDGWFPTRSSVVMDAFRRGEGVAYVGPCPNCRLEIRAPVQGGGVVCPECDARVAG